jgi:hypothetical protein
VELLIRKKLMMSLKDYWRLRKMLQGCLEKLDENNKYAAF